MRSSFACLFVLLAIGDLCGWSSSTHASVFHPPSAPVPAPPLAFPPPTVRQSLNKRLELSCLALTPLVHLRNHNRVGGQSAFEMGTSAYASGDLKAAERWFTASLDQTPGDMSSLSNLAMVVIFPSDTARGLVAVWFSERMLLHLPTLKIETLMESPDPPPSLLQWQSFYLSSLFDFDLLSFQILKQGRGEEARHLFIHLAAMASSRIADQGNVCTVRYAGHPQCTTERVRISQCSPLALSLPQRNARQLCAF